MQVYFMTLLSFRNINSSWNAIEDIQTRDDFRINEQEVVTMINIYKIKFHNQNIFSFSKYRVE
jgi:hypothetical protein